MSAVPAAVNAQQGSEAIATAGAAPASPLPEPAVDDAPGRAAALSSAASPVDVSEAHTLHVALSVEEAAQELRAALAGAAARYGHHASGVVRWEVPLPRGATALQWLQGQARQAALRPSVYFSPRRSSAPDTGNGAAAEAASAGAGAVAGAGAAWLWTGTPGEPLDYRVMSRMQRLLMPGCGRLRAFGGSRFNTAQAPVLEWAAFGSYYFLLPRLEFLEAAGCCLLSCNVAWDAGASAGGFASLEEALADAVACLAAVQPPAPPAAPALQVHQSLSHTPDRGGWERLLAPAPAFINTLTKPLPLPAQQVHRQGLSHTPDRGGWERLMAPVHDSLAPAPPELADGLSQYVDANAARQEYVLNGQDGLDGLLAALDGGVEDVGSAMRPQGADALTKVVLARRSDVVFHGELDALALLAALQERDPRAYQLALQLPGGCAFVASTPEQLYVRNGAAVASEAVAGTRPRGSAGDVERDFWLAFDLLRSPKDHAEFMLVRDWIAGQLADVCSAVQVDRPKSVLKQGAVQHLYGRLSAKLRPGCADAELLAALHPTPAVCGRPREHAADLLLQSEAFDRGFYAGPFGWVGASSAEFAVAIRSALVHAPALLPPGGQPDLGAALPPRGGSSWAATAGGDGGTNGAPVAGVDGQTPAAPWAENPAAAARAAAAAEDARRITLYAGVGIVDGSQPASEWAELELKVRQFESLLHAPPALAAAPNINALAARMTVEELCRLGISTFAIAPGSRSSPLALAAAQHPRARVTCCIDERSLAFWALGFGRATRVPAVVVTSSGTAVANLLPAVVEAAQAGVPLLLLTADRPGELRGCGANQTIDQVKIFSGYTRWAADLAPPDGASPARALLTALDAAAAAATGPAAGPVHVNFQFREPLGPAQADWPRSVLQGLEAWEAGTAPFTQYDRAAHALPAPGGGLQAALAELRSARRGLLVVGELQGGEQAAAARRIGAALGWPLVADVLSGLRLGGAGGGNADASSPLIAHMDHLLLLGRKEDLGYEGLGWRALAPDCVLQLGGHLTSKRLGQFLDWAALGSADRPPARWVYADAGTQRHDPSHLLSRRLQAPLPALAAALEAGSLSPSAAAPPADRTAGAHSAAVGASAAAAAAVQPAAAALSRRRSPTQQGDYAALLALLDGVAAREIDSALAVLGEQLTEPHVARVLSQNLPAGDGLFLGNSMPIRDMDMYADPASAQFRASGDAASEPLLPLPAHGFGVVQGAGGATPVAANRGASGIDGVLSTAAGFAEGLGRGTTLVVGDVSFLHDVNGLNLLRTSGARPPLTVVLVNNGGGGIFSFLPAAEQIPQDTFTELWATPQHVDLMGMCRAHGIAHQAVRLVSELPRALESAWRLNRHSVVEVFTSRTENVGQHRAIQATVRDGVAHALRLALGVGGLGPPLQSPLPPQQSGAAQVMGAHPNSSSNGRHGSNNGGSNGSGPPGTVLVGSSTQPTAGAAATAAATRPRSPAREATRPFAVRLETLSLRRFRLPLAAALTTSAGGGDRQGLLLELSWRAGGRSGRVFGEISPLPGLHREGLEEAAAQAALLCELLLGADLNATAGLLEGRLGEWLYDVAGVDTAVLLPSVRCGVEAALLSALGAAAGMFLAELLGAKHETEFPASDGPAVLGGSPATGGGRERAHGGSLATEVHGTQPVGRLSAGGGGSVGVSGLVDSCESAAATAMAAVALVRQGYTTLKLKVGRHSDPLADAEAVLTVRAAVGPDVELRCDANRAWDLESATAFGIAAAPAQLQFVEEPVADAATDLAAFHAATGIATALDESLDAGLVGPDALNDNLLQGTGVAALVVKPAVVGGFEAALRIAVISSSFESALGLSQLAQLAAAVDASWATSRPATAAATSLPLAHGLGTAHWLAADLSAAPLVSVPTGAAGGGVASISVQTARRIAEGLDVEAAQRRGVLGSTFAPAPARPHVTVVTTSAGRYEFSWTSVEAQQSAAPTAQPAAPTAGGSAVAGAAVQTASGAAAAGTHAAAAPAGGAAAAAALEGMSSGGAALAPLTVLLHGFLGAPEDWAPIAQAVAAGGSRCVAVGLPGYSGTMVVPSGTEAEAYSLEAVVEAIAVLLLAIAGVQQRQLQQQEAPAVHLVGYSLGGRVALALAARHPLLVARVAIISGSPGLAGEAERTARAAHDDRLAASLLQGGLPAFVDGWYRAPMWAGLRARPGFDRIVQLRASTGEPAALAAALAGMSSGRQAPLWDVLLQLQPRLLFVGGADDGKFVALGRRMAAAINGDSSGGMEAEGAANGVGGNAATATNGVVPAASAAALGGGGGGDAELVDFAEVPGSGHAVHLERPEALALLLQQFFRD